MTTVPARGSAHIEKPAATPTEGRYAPGAALLSTTLGTAPNGATTVALVGDSKMDQWLPAFQVLAAQNDRKLVIAAKASCPFTGARVLMADGSKKIYTDCIGWNRTLPRRLVEERPDYVVSSQSAGSALDAAGRWSVDAMVAGVRSSWKQLDAVGTKVVVLANNPHPGPAIVQCADKHRKHLSAAATGSAVAAGAITRRWC